jgi:N-terminal domain of galactosyltransferase
MDADVSVVIAYRDMGDEHRRRSFRYVLDWYRPLGWELVVAGGELDETFTRASAINTAVREAHGRVIVQIDPDSLVPTARLHEAVALAAKCDGLVIPHDRYLYLDLPTTEDILGHRRTPFQVGPGNCETHGPEGSGNVVVFSRSTWATVGGFDERFGIWGGDDAAFAYAAAALCIPTRRLAGDMVHLWHPRLPQSVPGSPGFVEQFAILAEWRDAFAAGPEVVRQLVRGDRQ